MIISGGENISPAEIESVLLDCPDIAEAAVVGRPDERWGEVVVAVVAPRAAAQRSTRERVLALFDGRLARFKHPKDVLVRRRAAAHRARQGAQGRRAPARRRPPGAAATTERCA